MHPRRLLFIASIGNPKPYRRTRHSAGHLLLDALTPLLRARLAESAPFYTTWHNPSYMNESGRKLAREMQRWLSERDRVLQRDSLTTPTSSSTGYPATLVILHDELEAQPGKLRIKRGGPESASLRGHRGLISCFESLRGAGLYPSLSGLRRGASGRDLSVLRVGIGIGRPGTRGKNTVADYVLTEMEAAELAALQRAAEPVMRVIEEEFSWGDTGESPKE